MTEMSPPAKPRPYAVTPQLPWKTRFYLAVLSAVSDTARRSNGTVNRRFLSFLDARIPPSATPLHGVRTTDVTVDTSRGLWFRLFVPADSDAHESLPVIIFFHGGGFAFLSADSRAYDDVCRRVGALC
ncbi:putative carboxylesterase 18 [Canna indica]|uniref:Carboxylesterase 18 n=1 Tax=Canna indica TaxID=4628 RepID=A0AAQ3QAZ1_9LILI|nr:putative carboxylesterase 18 [Canna indica]